MAQPVEAPATPLHVHLSIPISISSWSFGQSDQNEGMFLLGQPLNFTIPARTFTIQFLHILFGLFV